ncbi:type VII secretion target [Gordonia sp. L191]|uniref:type VII secretion target n=1 Tax=Gordonia sp. L191 TaxID=2982699 RepID=UPI0024C043A6|nr:type VII secretion target [Gordonia sp. L191]WHU45371.1 type VII secretion target [Gordonia sp. L191]
MIEQLSVSPAALSAHAAGEAAAAARVGAHAVATDLTPLALTFGLIGADFLTTLGRVLDSRRDRLTAVADRHLTLSGESAAAAAAYTGVDDMSAATLSIAAGPAAEVDA